MKIPPTQLFQLLEKLCSSKFTTVEEIRDVVTAALPEDIAAWAIKEGSQVLIFTSSSPRLILILTPSSFCPHFTQIVAASDQLKSSGSVSLKKGFETIAFPPEVLTNNNYFLAAPPEPDAALFLMAVLEYVCADILKLAGNYGENHHRRTIDVGDIRATVSYFSVPPTPSQNP